MPLERRPRPLSHFLTLCTSASCAAASPPSPKAADAAAVDDADVAAAVDGAGPVAADVAVVDDADMAAAVDGAGPVAADAAAVDDADAAAAVDGAGPVAADAAAVDGAGPVATSLSSPCSSHTPRLASATCASFTMHVSSLQIQHTLWSGCDMHIPRNPRLGARRDDATSFSRVCHNPT